MTGAERPAKDPAVTARSLVGEIDDCVVARLAKMKSIGVCHRAY